MVKPLSESTTFQALAGRVTATESDISALDTRVDTLETGGGGGGGTADSINIAATPSTDADTVAAGTIWSDGEYIYVATATNTIRRAALADF